MESVKGSSVGRKSRKEKLESKESITSDRKIARSVGESKELPKTKKAGTSETETKGNIHTKEPEESKSTYYTDSYTYGSSSYDLSKSYSSTKSEENLKTSSGTSKERTDSESSISQSSVNEVVKSSKKSQPSNELKGHSTSIMSNESTCETNENETDSHSQDRSTNGSSLTTNRPPSSGETELEGSSLEQQSTGQEFSAEKKFFQERLEDGRDISRPKIILPKKLWRKKTVSIQKYEK